MPTECRSLTPMQEFYFQAGITWLEGGAGQQFNPFFMHAHVYIALFGCRLHECHMDASRGKARVDAMVGC